ncbi:cytochrome b [Variovorax sp. J2P1-59]|uniref:cytochrome b n=1 Tax=Variovorax flavidus TaxID=3053501 RepID=UPI00257576D4|nr:cytochrome b [Variovorax sp. J2P1-59]MDM0074057.1 cytochrome b [Variovorax sp. J2P1-59]
MRPNPPSDPPTDAKADAAWSASIRLFHWLVAVLIFSQFALGWLAVGWRLSPTKINLFVWHKSIGMLILALVAVRLLNRLARPTPPLPPDTPAWERAAARWSHALLYVLMVAMPLTGWVVNSAAGIPFRIFWQFPLPALIAPDKQVAEIAALVHFALGLAFVALLVLHIGAALRHHFIKRNNVLTRMLGTRRTVK